MQKTTPDLRKHARDNARDNAACICTDGRTDLEENLMQTVEILTVRNALRARAGNPT
jgi:hypothetical protein